MHFHIEFKCKWGTGKIMIPPEHIYHGYQVTAYANGKEVTKYTHSIDGLRSILWSYGADTIQNLPQKLRELKDAERKWRAEHPHEEV